MTNSEISFFVDTLLVETVLADPSFYKKGQATSDFVSKVKTYFESKIDPKNPTDSVLSILAPGAVSVLFSAMGLGKFGILAGLLMNVFHVDVGSMWRTLYGELKSMISGGAKASSEKIDQLVSGVVGQHATVSSPSEAQTGLKALQKQHAPYADDGAVYSSLELLHEAKIISLALIEYERQNLRLTKEAKFDPRAFMGAYQGNKAKGVSILGKVFGWIIKIALASAGLMVAGDIINSILGRPSSLSGTYQAGQPEAEAPAAEPSGPISTQKKYPSKGDEPVQGQVAITNTPENIDSMLVQFAKDVYSGLEGKESLIRSTNGFQAAKEKIVWQNVHNPGSRTTIMPEGFTSKKRIVDSFIDDVAKADKA